MDKIDFVVTWVDENDEKWKKDKQFYFKGYSKKLNDEARFREWNNLQYWFRAVEKYAPWVHRVFFVTNGQIPVWLNTKYPKLICVKHTDYIDNQYLPTFNSNAIELNIHKINQLSEHFVLFNDDTFLNKEVYPNDFFISGVPRDTGIFSPIVPLKNSIDTTVLNDVEIISSYFSTKDILKENKSKFFNFRYGKYNIKNLCVLPWKKILGFYDTHIPVSYNKSTFRTIWSLEKEKLVCTSQNKFRTKNDLNHWLMRYWQLASGKFIPRNVNFGKCYNISDDDVSNIVKEISNSRHKMICLNDNENLKDFKKAKTSINNAFQYKLSKKSQYEK